MLDFSYIFEDSLTSFILPSFMSLYFHQCTGNTVSRFFMLTISSNSAKLLLTEVKGPGSRIRLTWLEFSLTSQCLDFLICKISMIKAHTVKPLEEDLTHIWPLVN